MSLKLGINLPQYANTYRISNDVVEAARAAEEIGYDSVWAFERVLTPQDQSGAHGLYGVPDLAWPESYHAVADPIVTLSLAAAVTERVELGTGVLVAPLHAPVRLAKALATLDAAAGGRVIAGLGTGWSIDEFAATAPRPFAERGKALDEFLDVADAVWGPDPVALTTDRYEIGPALVSPKPARRIPVYLAGSNKTALARIARRADGWLPTGAAPEQVVSILAGLRATAAEAGRDPATVKCIFQVGVAGPLTEVPAAGRAPYTGSPAQVAEDIAVLAEGGVDHVYLTVSSTAEEIKQYIANAGALFDAVRAAGL